MADDHDVAGIDAASQQNFHSGFLAFKHSGCPVESLHIQASHLDYCAFGSERACQHGDAADVVDGVVKGVNDIAVRSRRRKLGQVLAHGFAGDSHLVGVELFFFCQHRHDHADAADAVYVYHVVFAGRFGVGQVRHTGCDFVEIFQGELHASFIGDSQQMQHGIGGAAQCHD